MDQMRSVLNIPKILIAVGSVIFSISVMCSVVWADLLQNHPSVESCDYLVHHTNLLFNNTIFKNTKKLVDDPHFNEAVWGRYLQEADGTKLIFLQADIEDLSRWRSRNIATLFNKNPELSIFSDEYLSVNPEFDCEFIDAVTEIYQQHIHQLKKLVNQLIEEDMNFDVDERFSLVPPSSYSTTVDERNRRWRHWIKFDKLVMSELLGGLNFEDFLNSDELKHHLKRRYDLMLDAKDRDELAYYIWHHAFFHTIDYASYPYSQIMRNLLNTAHSIYPDMSFSENKSYLKNSLNRTLSYYLPRIKSGIGFYLGGFPRRITYPSGIKIPFIAPYSYFLTSRDEVDSHKSRRRFLILEAQQHGYEFAVKSYEIPRYYVVSSPAYDFTVRMSHSENHNHQILDRTRILYIKMGSSFISRNKGLDFVGRSRRFKERIDERSMRWLTHPDVVIVDLRQVRFDGFVGAQYLDLFSRLFAPRTYLLQRISHIDILRKLMKRIVVSSVASQDSRPMFPDVPMVILMDNDSNGFSESFAYSFRLMKRAIVVGTGLKPYGSGDAIHNRTHGMNRNHYYHRFTSGLNYHINGRLHSGRSFKYDMFLTQQPTPLVENIRVHEMPRYPWHILDRQVLESIAFPEKLPLDSFKYPNYRMVSDEMIATLKHRHQQRTVSHDQKNHSFLLSSSSYRTLDNRAYEVSLHKDDFRHQLSSSIRELKVVTDQFSQLEADRLSDSLYQTISHPSALKLIASDKVLVDTFHIASDYYYILKRGGVFPEHTYLSSIKER